MATPFKLRSSGPFKMMGSSPVKQKTQTGNVTPNNKKLLKSERDGVMAYEGKSNTEIQNDLEDRIEFINEDISNDGKSTNQQKIDIAILRGKLRKAKEAAAKTDDDGNVLPTKGKPGHEPPVRRKNLDAKGKEMFDKNHGMTTKDGKPYMK